MDLILWRHAEAEPGVPDLERALTVKGQKQARRMGEWLASQLSENCRILVSPALRTLRTTLRFICRSGWRCALWRSV